MRQRALRVVRKPADQRVQHLAAQARETLALGHAPVVEAVAAGQLEAVEELALQRARRLLERLERRLRERPAAVEPGKHRRGVDLAGVRGEGDLVAVGLQARRAGLVDHAAQFGQAPAQRRAGVVGTFPEQVAQRRARLRHAGGDEVAEQRTRAARGRQRHGCAAGAAQLEFAEQPHRQRGAGGRRGGRHGAVKVAQARRRANGTVPPAQALLAVVRTSVGFATMSSTAERFCDCATSAAICSGVASASIA